jgi:hypothetical protein
LTLDRGPVSPARDLHRRIANTVDLSTVARARARRPPDVVAPDAVVGALTDRTWWCANRSRVDVDAHAGATRATHAISIASSASRARLVDAPRRRGRRRRAATSDAAESAD